MSEPVLIQQQRAILRALHQATSQHTQITTAADDLWQNVQRAYEEARARLAQIGEEKALTLARTTPPTAPHGADPAAAFRHSASGTLQAAERLRSLLCKTPTTWCERASWGAHRHGPLPGVMSAAGIIIRFSSDSRLLASGSFDKTVKIWEVSSGRMFKDFRWGKDVVGVIPPHFLLDGRVLLPLKKGNNLEIWEIISGHLLYTLRHEAPVTKVSFSPDLRLIASGSTDKTIRIWKVEGGQLLYTLKLDINAEGIGFSPDSHWMVSWAGESIQIWDVERGQQQCAFSGEGIILLPDNRVLLLKKGMLEVREIKSWQRLCVFSPKMGSGKIVGKLSPDGHLLALRKGKSAVEIWNVCSGQLQHAIECKDEVRIIIFSPNSDLLVTREEERTVGIWEITTGRLLQTWICSEVVTYLTFSPNSYLLAVGGQSSIWLLEGEWPELPAHSAELAQAMAEARFWYERAREQAAAAHRRTLQEQILTRYRQWQDKLAQIQQASAWQEPIWQAWAPTQNVERIPLRLGRLSAPLAGDQSLEWPALLPFPLPRSLLFSAAGPARTAAAFAIQSLLLRLLAAIPPGRVRFTFIDPVGLGQNVAPFMALADYDEQLVTARAWSDSRHIEQRLADLTEHIETVIQKYLRHEYATIEEYNEKAGEIAEPYRFLVVFDFPANFTEETARRLVSIVQNGPRCGVYTVILMDSNRPLPYGFKVADLEQASTVIAWKDDRWVWEDEDFREFTLELDGLPPAELFNCIIKEVGERAKEAGKVEVPIERIVPPREQWWQETSLQGLNVPLGPASARKVQSLTLGSGTSQHALVAGKTGSGKSTLLHVLITNLALRYSPDEVQVYLVDFKKGVEFKPYATYNLPHARVVAIESEREFGLSVLQGLDAELKRRGDLFRAAGVDHIADYRTRTGQPMPRILLVVDEFQEFFTEDDPIASQAAQVLDRLVRQGRAFGVHVLLGSQTLAGSYTLARSTIDQMAVRIALQCSEADSRLILADDNPAARLLSRPGEAIYNDANGLVEGNHPFQVAWLADEQREKYLHEIAALAAERQYRPPQPQIVFEGNAPAEVEKNRPLSDLLIAPTWPAKQRRVTVWLGDPIAIADPTAAHFRRQSGSNLLIVGQNDEAALGMMAVALISLAAQHAPQDATFYVLDFGAVDAPYAGLWDNLASFLPHQIKVGRRRQLPDLIRELADEVQQRMDSEQSGAPSRYLFLYGLQRARDLRQEEMGFGGFSSFGEEPAAPNPAQQFATILREGPDLGIHTIVCCDTVTNLNRSLDRRSLREFAMRVVFQMSAEDSANLIDSPLASKLGPYRALFYDEEEGRLEKFRPYGLPSAAWLEQVKAWLAGRQ